LHRSRRRVSWLKAPAVDDNKSVQFAGFVAGAGIGFGGRQKNRADEHGQTNDWPERSWSPTDRQDNQPRSGDSQENAKEQPRARVAPRMQDLGDKQHQGEQSADGKMAQPFAENPPAGKGLDWTQRSSSVSQIRSLKVANRRFHACVQRHAAREDGDRAANDQRHVERVDHFLALPPFFAAADQVVSDAVIAAQHRGGDQPEQFLCFGAERAGFVGLWSRAKKRLIAEVAAAEDFFVRWCEIFGESSRRSPWFLRGHIPTHQPCRYYGPTTAIAIIGFQENGAKLHCSSGYFVSA